MVVIEEKNKRIKMLKTIHHFEVDFVLNLFGNCNNHTLKDWKRKQIFAKNKKKNYYMSFPWSA